MKVKLDSPGTRTAMYNVTESEAEIQGNVT
jgi:hypothetical protein